MRWKQREVWLDFYLWCHNNFIPFRWSGVRLYDDCIRTSSSRNGRCGASTTEQRPHYHNTERRFWAAHILWHRCWMVDRSDNYPNQYRNDLWVIISHFWLDDNRICPQCDTMVRWLWFNFGCGVRTSRCDCFGHRCDANPGCIWQIVKGSFWMKGTHIDNDLFVPCVLLVTQMMDKFVCLITRTRLLGWLPFSHSTVCMCLEGTPPPLFVACAHFHRQVWLFVWLFSLCIVREHWNGCFSVMKSHWQLFICVSSRRWWTSSCDQPQ